MLRRIREGYRPTLAEKLANCGCIEELDGMLAQIRADRLEPSSAEAVAAQQARARLLGGQA